MEREGGHLLLQWPVDAFLVACPKYHCDYYYRYREAAMPKTSSIRLVISIQYRIVSDRHRAIAYTTLA